MTEAILEQLRAALEVRAGVSFRSEIVYGMLVVIGLLLEYAPELCHVPKRWTPSKVKAFAWIKPYELLGALMVTVGVAGELYFTVQSVRIEGAIREIEGQLLTSARKEAGEARESAAELEAQIQPRYLKKSQQEQITGALRPLNFLPPPLRGPGHQPLVHIFAFPEQESMRLARMLRDSITESGLVVEIKVMGWDSLIEGIEIMECCWARGNRPDGATVLDLDKLDLFVPMLQKALKEFGGLDSVLLANKDASRERFWLDSVVIIVGLKPAPK